MIKNIYIQFGQGMGLLGSSSPCLAKYQLARFLFNEGYFCNYGGKKNKYNIPNIKILK